MGLTDRVAMLKAAKSPDSSGMSAANSNHGTIEPGSALKAVGVSHQLATIPVDHSIEKDADRFAAENESRAPHFVQAAKMRSDREASRAAREVGALAITVGDTAFFREDAFTTSTRSGRELIAHEYAHILQNREKALYRKANEEVESEPEDAAKDHKVTIAVDREVQPLLAIGTHKDEEGEKDYPVGHTWLKLQAPGKSIQSYGFWPNPGFDPSNPFKAVNGKVKHPDKSHEKGTDREDYDYFVTQAQFKKVMEYVDLMMVIEPNYTLFDYNCTTFAAKAVEAAGLNPPHYKALAIPNPNSMFRGIKRRERREARQERREARRARREGEAEEGE